MVLCENYFDPESGRIMSGLKLIGGLCVLPHHETFGKNWKDLLRRLLPDFVLLGIDEQTGLVCDVSQGIARVLGKGEITIYSDASTERIGPGQELDLALLKTVKLP